MNRSIFAYILLMCTSATAAAQSVFAPVIERAVAADPAIAAAAARDEAAVSRMRSENTLEGPEAEFEYMFSSVDAEPNKWSVGISQEFSMPGVYSARSTAARATSQAGKAALDVMRYDRALVIKQAIIDLINSSCRLNLLRDLRTNIDRISELTTKSFDTGNATILDLRKMQLAVLDSDNAIAAARAEFEQLHASLLSMQVDADAFTPAMLAAYPEMKLEVGDFAPMQAMIDAQSRAAGAEASVARRSSLPSVSVGYRHAYEEGTHFNGFGISLRLPQWSRSNRTRAAKLEAEAVAFDASAQRIAFDAETDALMRQATHDAMCIERYRDLTSDNSYLELLRKSFEAGQLSVIDYLTEINLFTTARQNYLDLQYRHALTLVRLGRYNSIDF